MNKILTLIILSLLPYSVWSVRVSEPVSTITQSDGSLLRVMAYGQDKSSYYTTTDGIILYHVGFNFYVAKIASNGEITTSNILAHEKDLRSTEEINFIEEQDKNAFFSAMKKEEASARMKEPLKYSSTYFPHSGTPRALVVLAEFTDSVFSLDNPKATFNKYLNAKSFNSSDGTVADNYGSVAQYFSDMSFGTFVPQFDVYGPIKLPNNLKYYGEGSSDYMGRFIPDVCNAIDDSVDFSKYDENGDGFVDLLYVIYAGYSASWTKNSSDCIWPKSGTISIGKYYDGVQICRYGVNNELNAYPGAYTKLPYKHCNGIGLFCHEFSHCMGLPDLYPTSDAAQKAAVEALEYWDLMDGGEYSKNGDCPTAYSAWERETMGWMTIDTLKTSQNVSLTPVSEGGKAYRIMNDKDNTGHEYYIVENVQKKGWNQGVYGHGMLVYHVDYDETAFSLSSNSVNNTIGHSRMTLVAADGCVLSSEKKTDDAGNEITTAMYKLNMGGDPFPGTSNVRFLTDTSAVKSVVYTGIYMGKPIVYIREDTLATNDFATISFKFYTSNEELATKIETPSSMNEDNGDNKIYTLDGIYVGTDMNTLKKGIYIRNRHKVVI
jgi:immune inhibitor A